MSLSDKEILELNELVSALIDQRITSSQRERLSGWLAESEEVRRYYVSALSQSASLHSYANERHADAAPPKPIPFGSWRWVAGALAAAACVTVAIWGFNARRVEPGPLPLPSPAFVARISAAKDALWQGALLKPGSPLPKGQDVQLTAGYAEITFDSGAKLILEGPAHLTVNSAWESTLRRGTLRAVVPPQAIGFRISNPSVEIVDLGTEFTMIAGSDGSAEVLVLKGEVEAAPRNTLQEQEVLLLRERESRRFARNGVSEVVDRDRKFAHFSQSPTLERFSSAYRYAHWSFDSPERLSGRYVSGDADARSMESAVNSVADPTTLLAPGQTEQALQLNGSHYLRTTFPGLSGASPHTVAFWVRVPENAPLSDAYSIMGWRSSLAKLSYRPVHISWNRNPNEGALGAIRTDFGGGCAIGSSSLRDGRWHHIAIVFSPGADDAPVQVKQYVDGHLESSHVVPGRTRGPAGDPDRSLDDSLWIGSRIGVTGPRQERFRGEVDELFIADGALEPREIVQLQRENRIDAADTAFAQYLPANTPR